MLQPNNNQLFEKRNSLIRKSHNILPKKKSLLKCWNLKWLCFTISFKVWFKTESQSTDLVMFSLCTCDDDGCVHSASNVFEWNFSFFLLSLHPNTRKKIQWQEFGRKWKVKASPCQLELFAQMMISNVEGLIQQFVSPSLPNLIIAVPNGHQQKNSVEVMFGPKKKKLMRNFSQQPRFVTVSVFVRRQNKSFV